MKTLIYNKPGYFFTKPIMAIILVAFRFLVMLHLLHLYFVSGYLIE